MALFLLPKPLGFRDHGEACSNRYETRDDSKSDNGIYGLMRQSPNCVLFPSVWLVAFVSQQKETAIPILVATFVGISG